VEHFILADMVGVVVGAYLQPIPLVLMAVMVGHVVAVVVAAVARA
jgi:hypothetical protein